MILYHRATELRQQKRNDNQLRLIFHFKELYLLKMPYSLLLITLIFNNFSIYTEWSLVTTKNSAKVSSILSVIETLFQMDLFELVIKKRESYLLTASLILTPYFKKLSGGIASYHLSAKHIEMNTLKTK